MEKLTASNETIHRNNIDDQIMKIISYFSLVIIGIGVVGNLNAFIVLRASRRLNKMSSMTYLSFVVVADTLSLFVWNLNHFIRPIIGTGYEMLEPIKCRIFTFIQYFGLQSSGLLLSMLCVDRYFSIAAMPGSFLSRLPFNTPRSALIWSTLIMSALFVINSHILIFNGYFWVNETSVYDASLNATISLTTVQFECYRYSSWFTLSPFWDEVNTYLYSFVPFLIMCTFNVLLIVRTVRNRQTASNESARQASQRRRMTITLLIITFAFIIMTIPSTIAFGYLYEILQATGWGRILQVLIDYMSFLNHSSIFFTCTFTNKKFRQSVVETYSFAWFFIAKNVFKVKNEKSLKYLGTSSTPLTHT
jgi:hypothetical protein